MARLATVVIPPYDGTDVTARQRRPAGLRRTLAIVLGTVALLFPTTSASAAPIWTKNLYTSSAFLYQDPYSNACTAAATMIMLNTIAYRHTGGQTFTWRPYRVQKSRSSSDLRDMTSILWFERAHDTLSARGSGSDPHGWRNALNYYGWGGAALTTLSKRVYEDKEYTSYTTAMHAAVRAIARFQMPVGIVTWAGRHAQVMTGYVVEGANPVDSDAFTVRSVYLSDPLRGNGLVNTKVSNTTLSSSGSWRVRFQRYREADSPWDDRYSSGWKRSSVYSWVGPSEWYNRWVLVIPTVGFVDQGEPAPTPTPTPPPATPTPPPTASPTPTPPAPTPPAATPAPTATPSSSSPSSGEAASEAPADPASAPSSSASAG